MVIYEPDGTKRYVVLTKEAEHEEELMKGDFVRLSWADADYYKLPVGSYIIPFEDVVDVEGNPAKFMLFKDYLPSDTPQGYRYEPQFEHPKMWLGYVPFLFETKDATGATVRKTEHNEVGRLSDIMMNLCTFVNNALGLTGANSNDGTQTKDTCFIPVYMGVDSSQTVSVQFADMDVLSAIAAVANVVGCEYHMDWQLKLLYFGKIMTGVEPYRLEVDKNVGTPSVTNSKDTTYNRYLVQGSTRNNVRKTEHGWQATGTRLTLPEEYDGSIIDLRRTEPHRTSDTFIPGREGEPPLTGIMNLDDVYPHLDLYLYDVRERKKYKVDESKNITSELWSVWYIKLAYKDQHGFWNDYTLDGEPYATVGQITANGGEDAGTLYVPALFLKDLGYSSNIFNGTSTVVTVGSYAITGFLVTVTIDGISLSMVAAWTNRVQKSTGMEVGGNGNVVLLAQTGASLPSCKVNDVVTFTAGVNRKAFPSANIDTRRVDGLVPTLAFRVNETTGAMASPLGTREFEVEYHGDSITFDNSDDVERPQGASGFGYKGDELPAGYYEIIKKEEGSDNLIVPTTREQGIIPLAGDTPSEGNNIAFLFNIAPDGVMVSKGREELLDKAKEEIGSILADTNNYTFPSNPVAFEHHNPRLTIGRKVAYKAYGYELTTRILKLVTKVDYPFEQTITIGNKILKGMNARLTDEINALKSDFSGWATQGVTLTGDDMAVVEITYDEWTQNGLFYHEDLNRYHVDDNGNNRPIIEQSYVRHLGSKWKCLRTLTTQEPWPGCSDWLHVEGNAELSMKFYTVDGVPYGDTISVRPSQVNIPLIPHVFFGYEDISDRLGVGSDVWSWARSIVPGAWTERTYIDSETGEPTTSSTRSVRLTNNDMPGGWGLTGVSFTCTALVSGIPVSKSANIG